MRVSGRGFICNSVFGIAVAAGCVCWQNNVGAASVWKVSSSSGNLLYLGGSIHALTQADYPLPPEYSRACDASQRIIFEVNPIEMKKAANSVRKAAQYPPGDNLKNHVDPRTYEYLRRFFRALNVPEEKFAKLRPWCLAFMLEAPQLHGLSVDLGVEGFLTKRAQAKSKPISGLESVDESIKRYSGLTDQQGEVMLLMSFIPGERGMMDRAKKAWRRGDSETVWQITQGAFHDVPSIAEREVIRRNHNWIPKIENYLQAGDKSFIVVGAGHMGGPDGLLALLRGRGYKIEQL